MSPGLENPFRPPHEPTLTDAQAVGKVLGAQDRQAMELVLGEEEGEPNRGNLFNDIALLETEKATAAEARETLAERRRRMIVEWVHAFDIDDGWIKEHIDFFSDGTAVVNGDIDGWRTFRGAHALPEGIKEVTGNLVLSSVEAGDQLNLPEIVGGDLTLASLSSANGLKLPKVVRGMLFLNSLQSAEGLVFPEEIGGVSLQTLSSAEGLVLPKNLSGNLYLSGLKSSAGLNLPETVGGRLHLNGLTTAEGLRLPRTVGEEIQLAGLTTAVGLEIPEFFTGTLYVGRYTDFTERLRVPTNKYTFEYI